MDLKKKLGVNVRSLNDLTQDRGYRKLLVNAADNIPVT